MIGMGAVWARLQRTRPTHLERASVATFHGELVSPITEIALRSGNGD